MQRKQTALLCISGAAGVLAVLLSRLAGSVSASGWLAAAGEGLRGLSLSGPTGNLAAWGIVYLLSVPPVLWMLLQWRHREKCPADLLAVLSSLLVLGGLFLLANPTQSGSPAPQLAPLLPLFFWGTALSVLVCWWVLLTLKKLNGGSLQILCRALTVLLFLAAALIAFSALYSTASGCVLAWQSLQEGAVTDQDIALFGLTIHDTQLGQNSAVLMVILALLRLIPELLGAVVLLWGADLIRAVQHAPFGDESVAQCERTAWGCRLVVQCSVALTVCTNLIQLAVLPHVTQTSFSVHLPLFTLLLSAALLLLCRCLQRGRELQEDSDSII